MTITQLGERLGVKVEVLPVGGGDEAAPCCAADCTSQEEHKNLSSSSIPSPEGRGLVL